MEHPTLGELYRFSPSECLAAQDGFLGDWGRHCTADSNRTPRFVKAFAALFGGSNDDVVWDIGDDVHQHRRLRG